MAQTLGLIELIWQGQKIDIEKGGKVKLGGLQAKSVITGKQVDYANEFEPSEITANMRLRAGTALLPIWNQGQGELQVLCDTGQSYTFPDAFLTNRPDFTAGEGGKIPLKYAAGAPTELLS